MHPDVIVLLLCSAAIAVWSVAFCWVSERTHKHRSQHQDSTWSQWN